MRSSDSASNVCLGHHYETMSAHPGCPDMYNTEFCDHSEGKADLHRLIGSLMCDVMIGDNSSEGAVL